MEKPEADKPETLFSRVARWMGWTRSSYVILGVFMLTVLLITYVWWPLTKMIIDSIDWQGDWWRRFDWLLVGIFLFMTLVIMSRADLRKDALIIGVGLIGGLVIEGWGTQTYLWWYFTEQRPPLWIIPAWPIASLTIDRIVRWVDEVIPKGKAGWETGFHWVYWIVFPIFTGLMFIFVLPTIGQSLTVMALLLVVVLVITPVNQRFAVITFLVGAGLGYFLEFWGTTRECWTYYTLEKPPFFAVLAHGMAAVAFWRSGDVLVKVWGRFMVKAGLAVRQRVRE